MLHSLHCSTLGSIQHTQSIASAAIWCRCWELQVHSCIIDHVIVTTSCLDYWLIDLLQDYQCWCQLALNQFDGLDAVTPTKAIIIGGRWLSALSDPAAGTLHCSTIPSKPMGNSTHYLCSLLSYQVLPECFPHLDWVRLTLYLYLSFTHPFDSVLPFQFAQ